MADYIVHDTTLVATSSAIRKVEGSSDLINPLDYPKHIRLMGMLPTSTASGAIAHIEDGADDVPTSSCEVEIAPTLTGVSSVSVVRTGKNLFNIDASAGTPNPTDGSNTTSPRILEDFKSFVGLRSDNYYYPQYANVSISNGEITVTNGSNNAYGMAYCFPVSPNLVFSVSFVSDVTPLWSVGYYDKAWNYISASSAQTTTSGTLTAPSNAYHATLILRVQANSTCVYSSVQIEIGSTASAYEAYVTPTTYTASLGRTVYGGSIDIVNGTGTETHNKITLSSMLDGLTMAQIGTTGVYRVRFNLSDAKGAANTEVFNGLCDYYAPSTANQTYAQNEGIAINTSGQCFIYDSRFNTSTSLNDFKTWIDANPVNLCYELATGTDFTFTGQEVPTRLGVNNFFSNVGDMSVTYRRDINLALGGE